LVKKKNNDKLYAMKVLKKSVIKLNNQEDHTKTERKILEKIDHPFIVSLHYAFQDEKKLYLVTEFMQGGELFYHLRRERVFKEDRARFYVTEIVLALEYLHKNNCIYRDLKPENILLDKDGHIKLTDFGLSKIVLTKNRDDSRAFTICGTPEYLAPEILIEKGYDKCVDWWSLGALFYEMLAGYSPYKTQKDNKLELENYTKKIYMQPYFSENAKSFIQNLLIVDPKNRLGSGPNGSQNVKSHPFFNNINWDDTLNKRIIPPYIPVIRDTTDLSNFDKMFTDENILEPNSEKGNNPLLLTGTNAKNNYMDFAGFTYKRESLFSSEVTSKTPDGN
jgi:serine/threonine protein kinase